MLYRMEEKLYLCSHCKKYKPAKDFSKATRNKHRDMLNCTCKICYKLAYNENRKKIEESKALESILKVRLHDALVRSKKKNLFIDITVVDLQKLWNKQNGKCALTGFPMTLIWGNGKKNIYNLSIDRIDSFKGYTKDNIQLVCAAANMMKGFMESDELMKFCEAILKNKKNA